MDIQTKIDRTWDFCINTFGKDRCIALCLHGSQNYNCAMPDSDVDAKLILAPTWDEVVHNIRPQSETRTSPYGDVNVVDVRLFIGVNLRKQNFNFIECLFTPYHCVNDAYADLWNELLEHREIIAHYKPGLAVSTMVGQANNQNTRWGRFDDKKTLYHMMRITEAIRKYCLGYAFEDTLIPDNLDEIMAVRQGKVSQEDMEKIFKEKYHQALSWLDYATQVQSFEVPADDIMEHLQTQFVYRALYELRVLE